jgi:hypothetical protein
MDDPNASGVNIAYKLRFVVNFTKSVTLILPITLFAMGWQPMASSAQTVRSLQATLNSYLHGKTGNPQNETVTITNFWKAVVPCPERKSCPWTPTFVMAAFHEGDGGGQALFANNSRCPSCYRILTAGGGKLRAHDIESFGIDAKTAASLASGR